MEKMWVHKRMEESNDRLLALSPNSDGSELSYVEDRLIQGLIALNGKINEIVEWINEHERAGGERKRSVNNGESGLFKQD